MSLELEEFAVQVVVSGIPMLLSYSLPPEHQGVDVGAQVVIDVGKSTRTGWVVKKESLGEVLERLRTSKREIAHHAQRSAQRSAQPAQLSLLPPVVEDSIAKTQLKPIVDSFQAFLTDQLPLFEWMASYYGVHISEVIDNAIPQKSTPRPVTCLTLTAHFHDCLSQNERLLLEIQKRAPLQGQVLHALLSISDSLPVSQLRFLGNSITRVIKELEKKEFIKTLIMPPEKFAADLFVQRQAETIHAREAPAQLTPAQEQALSKIHLVLEKKEFCPMLLFGVTGSGKTEVYLRAIQEVLQGEGSALVIVPEIALTPQLLDHFCSRLQLPIAVLHSQVGETDRWLAWNALLSGKIRLAIGARSSVFAPLQNLRLIIVDEEHDSSYKQSEGFRYHGRDVAVMRAKFLNCPVILGSATPSFESLLNVKRGKYQLLELPERVSTRPLPKLEIIDRSQVKKRDMPSEHITPQLNEAIKDTLARGGQVIILYNRRGFSTYLQCGTCSQVIDCPNCSISLTYHQGRKTLLCHYCDYSMKPPNLCPACRDPRLARVDLDLEGQPLESARVVEKVGALHHRGGGTEKVVDELAVLFPDAKIARMDRDTVTKKDSYRTILGNVRSGDTNILVGTQMIAKGHDLPGVTLVGIIDADVGLHFPDFRSSEKVFQLITQAAGRAGRGEEPGKVIVQSCEPNHPTIVATATNRFRAFARFELDHRKALGYPPWGRLLRLILSSPSRGEALQAAQLVRRFLLQMIGSRFQGEQKENKLPQISVLGPSPAPYERLRGRFRLHLLIKSDSARAMSIIAQELNHWKSAFGDKPWKDVRLAVDVDPTDML